MQILSSIEQLVFFTFFEIQCEKAVEDDRKVKQIFAEWSWYSQWNSDGSGDEIQTRKGIPKDASRRGAGGFS